MRKRPDPERFVEARATTRLSEAIIAAPATNARPTAGTTANAPAPKQAPDGTADLLSSPGNRRRGPSAFARAVSLLARREYSRKELIAKLEAKGVSPEEAAKTLDTLQAQGLQSDQRFLESKLRLKKHLGHGPRRAQVDLRSHGLEEHAVEAALADDPSSWKRAAYDLIERRFGACPLPRDRWPKAMATLLRRGFSYDLAQSVLSTSRADAAIDEIP